MAEQKQAEKPASLRMVYLPFTARGGPLRLAAAYGGIKLEERNIGFEEQAKEKSEGKRRWAGIPELFILDKDGKETGHIGQSNACLRYIGKLAGLYPSDAYQAAIADEICDSIEDISSTATRIALGSKDAEEKTAQAVQFCKEEKGHYNLRYWMDKFLCRINENTKRGNKNGLFVGDSLTIADIKFTQIEFYLIQIIPGAEAVLKEDKYKPLMDLITYVKSNEKLKACLDEYLNRENIKAAMEGLKKGGIIVN